MQKMRKGTEKTWAKQKHEQYKHRRWTTVISIFHDMTNEFWKDDSFELKKKEKKRSKEGSITLMWSWE